MPASLVPALALSLLSAQVPANPYGWRTPTSGPPLRNPPIAADCLGICDSLAWVTRADVPSVQSLGEGVEGAAAGIVAGKIYVSHGYSFGDVAALRIYDIASDTWTLGSAASVVRSEGAGAAIGDRFYSIGGRTAIASVEILDTTTGLWSNGNPMPTPRKGIGVGVINGRIHVVGGSPNGSGPHSGNPIDVHEVYDPGTDAWSSRSPLPLALTEVFATAALGDKLYVFGGWDGTQVVGSTFIYDAASDTWSSGAPMPTARSNALAGILAGRILVISGLDGLLTNLSTVEVYDPPTDSWCTGPGKPVPVSELAVGGVSTANAIHVIGSGAFGVSGRTHEALQLSSAGPIPAAAAGSAPCEGGDLTLDGSASQPGGCTGGLEFQWSQGASVLCPWSATPTCTTALSGTATFTLEVRCASNPDCLASRTVTASAVPFPTPDLLPLADLCAGGSATLDASGTAANGCLVPLEYQFSDGALVLQAWSTAASYGPFTPAASATYTVEARCTAAPGCLRSASRPLTVLPTPSAVLAPLASICAGGSITLDAGATAGNGCPVPLDYQFRDGLTVLAAWGPAASYGPFTPAASSTYWVDVRCTANPGCSSSASQPFDLVPVPTADLSAPAPTCAGGSITLDAAGSSGNGCAVALEYQFRAGAAVLQAWSTAASYGPFVPAAPATYTVEVRCTAAPGCLAATAQAHVVTPVPGAALGVPGPICAGSSVTLDASGSTARGCPVPLDYQFRDGATVLRPWAAASSFGPFVPPASTTFYVDVRCAGAAVCQDQAAASLGVLPEPVAAAGPDLRPCRDDVVTLDGSGSATTGCPGGALYEWRQGAAVLRPASPVPTWNPPTVAVGSVTYTLVAACAGLPACADGDDVVVDVRSCTVAVQFGPLRARREPGGVRLTWMSLSEEGSLWFEVERRSGAGGDFLPLGLRAEALGSGSSYELLDRAAPGGAIYRVVEYTDAGRGDVSPEFGETAGPAPSGRNRRRAGRGRSRGGADR